MRESQRLRAIRLIRKQNAMRAEDPSLENPPVVEASSQVEENISAERDAFVAENYRAEQAALPAENLWAGQGAGPGGELAGEEADWPEQDFLEEGAFPEDFAPVVVVPMDEEKQKLFTALVILAALYVVCGIVPLFVAVFAPRPVFFWMEISGWIIIIAWLIVGVRPPFMAWFRHRKQTSESE